MYTVVAGVLLRPLPFAGAERLVQLGVRRRPTGLSMPHQSPGALVNRRARGRVVARVATHQSRSVVLDAGEPRRLRTDAVSAECSPHVADDGRLRA